MLDFLLIQLSHSIVALHGLTGHAWNTFTTSELIDKQGDRIQENNWLRDNLPHLLEQSPQQKIYSRVMTFGYNADVWMTKSVADLEVPVNNLIWYLETERHQVREMWCEASIMLISCRIPKDHFSL